MRINSRNIIRCLGNVNQIKFGYFDFRQRNVKVIKNTLNNSFCGKVVRNLNSISVNDDKVSLNMFLLKVRWMARREWKDRMLLTSRQQLNGNTKRHEEDLNEIRFLSTVQVTLSEREGQICYKGSYLQANGVKNYLTLNHFNGMNTLNNIQALTFLKGIAMRLEESGIAVTTSSDELKVKNVAFNVYETAYLKGNLDLDDRELMNLPFFKGGFKRKVGKIPYQG